MHWKRALTKHLENDLSYGDKYGKTEINMV